MEEAHRPREIFRTLGLICELQKDWCLRVMSYIEALETHSRLGCCKGENIRLLDCTGYCDILE